MTAPAVIACVHVLRAQMHGRVRVCDSDDDLIPLSVFAKCAGV